LHRAGDDGSVLRMSIASEFANVTAVTKANVYFGGKVVSHTIKFPDGTKKTLGLIYAGEYHFGTDAPETMEIVAGTCRVKLDGGDAWQDHAAGTFFKVPGKSGFTIDVPAEIAEYICSFG
jgi:purine/pyrimidine-nucleoside phosphorylase